jgi:hypothetical protein
LVPLLAALLLLVPQLLWYSAQDPPSSNSSATDTVTDGACHAALLNLPDMLSLYCLQAAAVERTQLPWHLNAVIMLCLDWR